MTRPQNTLNEHSHSFTHHARACAKKPEQAFRQKRAPSFLMVRSRFLWSADFVRQRGNLAGTNASVKEARQQSLGKKEVYLLQTSNALSERAEEMRTIFLRRPVLGLCSNVFFHDQAILA